jgi:hypothetical protein
MTSPDHHVRTTGTADYVGSLDLLDLDLIGKYLGKRYLPYPFMFTRPSRFATFDEASTYAATVPDRFRYGDLFALFGPLNAYDNADIRVECHVQYIPSDTASVRLIAYRADERGFVASQRPDADVVDVYGVSPYELGSSICDFVTLDRPGESASIVVPEYVPPGGNEFDQGDYTVRDVVESRRHVVVPQTAVSAYSTVQSRWSPTLKWGPDRSKESLLWIRVRDDGDYIYESGRERARPMTDSMLRQRIDQLIAEDVAILREIRRD